jgi:hypothetical protein
MVRRLCTLLLVALALPAAAGAGTKPLATTHIHCLDRAGDQLLHEGMRRSATLNRLVARIEASDVVVLLKVKETGLGPVGKTQIMTAVPGARYVLVTVDPRAVGMDLVGRLAHELQHVAEIADAPEVRDVASLRALLTRIGWSRGDTTSWETKAAIETGRQAAREAGERPTEVGNVARGGRPSLDHQ